MRARAVRSLAPPPPPLENGDRLSRAEFERRYDAMPGLKKAELIDGVVHMPSPVRLAQHGSPHSLLMTWLGTYWIATAGTLVGDNTTLRLDEANEPQPDALLMIERGGQARVDADGYVAGAPELVCEVVAEGASIELHSKLQMYRRARVREYLVWRVADGQIDWLILRGRSYQALAADDAGVRRSVVFPGLWLDGPASLRLDGPAVITVLQQGLASAEHRTFVERLAASARQTP